MFNIYWAYSHFTNALKGNNLHMFKILWLACNVPNQYTCHKIVTIKTLVKLLTRFFDSSIKKMIKGSRFKMYNTKLSSFVARLFGCNDCDFFNNFLVFLKLKGPSKSKTSQWWLLKPSSLSNLQYQIV
jgi:hypothetical protein